MTEEEYEDIRVVNNFIRYKVLVIYDDIKELIEHIAEAEDMTKERVSEALEYIGSRL
jgi:hypothetical protein